MAATKEKKEKTKDPCPISRKIFRTKAKGLKIEVPGFIGVAPPKEFETGSLGWYLTGKTVVEIDGVPCPVQVGVNLTLVRSKELPED